MKQLMILLTAILILSGCENQLSQNTPQPQNDASQQEQQDTQKSPSPLKEELTDQTKQPEQSQNEESQNDPEASQQPIIESGHVLGEFMTNLYDKQEPRLHNIELAISKLDGVVLEPGQEFSFNTIVGPRSKDKGYKKAVVFEGKKKKKDYGGGVCQVSTTIFNAAKNANLKITEQSIHQREVPYIESGSDASVSYGEMDFRFVNTYDYWVRIGVSMTENNITAQITKV